MTRPPPDVAAGQILSSDMLFAWALHMFDTLRTAIVGTLKFTQRRETFTDVTHQSQVVRAKWPKVKWVTGSSEKLRWIYTRKLVMTHNTVIMNLYDYA